MVFCCPFSGSITDETIAANAGKTYQDVTALRDPLAGLTGGTDNPFDASAAGTVPTADYSPDQPRDDHGRWSSEGGNTEYPAGTDLPQIPDFNPLPGSQVVAVLREEAQPWIESLSDAERIAFQKYTYNPGDTKPNRFYERLNRMLRGDSPEDENLRMYAEKISNALKQSPLQHDVLCYRTVDVNLFNGASTGDIFSPNQFYSTSVVKTGALKKKYNIIIYARAGSYAGYVEPLSKFKEQRELLLDKDNLYRVLSVKKKEIVLEVILP